MNTRVFIAVIALFALVEMLTVGFFLFFMIPVGQPVSVPTDASPDQSATRSSNDLSTPEAMREKIETLEQENTRLRQRNEELASILGLSKETGDGPARAGGSTDRPERDPGSEGDEEYARKRDGQVSWPALAESVARLMALIPKDGERPSPDLMKVASQFMADVAAMQKELGLDDPGFVTESPAFKVSALEKLLASTDTPLTAAEQAALADIVDDSQEAFLEAAREREGEFALDRWNRVLTATEDFSSKVDGIVSPDRLKGHPVLERGQKEVVDAAETPWPNQTSIGVDDAAGAAERLSERWKAQMQIPDTEMVALKSIARDYAEQALAAQRAAGVKEGKAPSAKVRQELDHRLAELQLSALRRVHDTLNLDDATRQRVREYDTLDRFELGSNSTWSRSGSYGGFQFSGGSRRVEERRNR